MVHMLAEKLYARAMLDFKNDRSLVTHSQPDARMSALAFSPSVGHVEQKTCAHIIWRK